jgi:hypothetical protein
VQADTKIMLMRITLVAALIAVALVVVRQQRLLQNAGLIGYCSQVVTPAGKTGFWHECRPGKITGTPGLPLGPCKLIRHQSDDVDVWRCPTELAANSARQ